ncbi:putative anti-sigma factor [Mycobacterium xenopi 4042]|uniref:Putative anti-sigma factor n=1 Tax=Mycobacterium xenopi 4042 TaxID=1299334 RepID=X7YJY3_MYCXE|nr:putative anti-sigma factor [Mycobacterium xenopi 4042]
MPRMSTPLRARGADQSADRQEVQRRKGPEHLRERLRLEISRTTIIRG